MSNANGSMIPRLLRESEADLLEGWVREQTSASTLRSDLITDSELRQQSSEFLALLREAARNGDLSDVGTPAWNPLREMLAEMSRKRATQGFTPSETATFVLSFKQPLFALLRQEMPGAGPELLDEVWRATALLDKLALFTAEAHQGRREELIRSQQEELIELSTPVVKLWEGILVVPLIGTLDSARTQMVMENLLDRIVDQGAAVAIIDITGVPTVDTLVAQHLIKTVTAVRMMGAECIISGIRPQIAQTMVHLGVTLQEVVTKANLSEAIALAFRKSGFVVARAQPKL